MVRFVDTHCHLDFYVFDQDRGEVLDRSREAGVYPILNPGIDLETSRAAIKLAEANPNVYAAVGVHPNDGQAWTDSTIKELRNLARHPKVVAIGEIGLDYYRDRTPHNLQMQIFRAQLALASEVNLPVIIHSRQAGTDVLTVLTQWYSALARHDSPLADRPGVLHSFEGDLETAQRAIDMRFYIGVTGPLTYQNAPERRALFSILPIERILTETDSPFLAPHPYRGQRNEPAFIRVIAEALSSTQNLPLSTVAETTSANAARLFAWRVTD